MENLVEWMIFGVLVTINITMFYIIAGLKAGHSQDRKFFIQNAEWIGDGLDVLFDLANKIFKQNKALDKQRDEGDKLMEEEDAMAQHLEQYEAIQKKNRKRNG